MGRAPCCEKEGLKKGRWTTEEDEILLNYIEANGEGSWRSLPKNAGLLRCGKSCRLRWINYLRSGLKKCKFSSDEEDMIIKLHGSLGNRWSLIAGCLPGRTDNEIKNHWNSRLSRRIDSFRRLNEDGLPILMDIVKGRVLGHKRKGSKVSRWALKNTNHVIKRDKHLRAADFSTISLQHKEKTLSNILGQNEERANMVLDPCEEEREKINFSDPNEGVGSGILCSTNEERESGMMGNDERKSEEMGIRVSSNEEKENVGLGHVGEEKCGIFDAIESESLWINEVMESSLVGSERVNEGWTCIEGNSWVMGEEAWEGLENKVCEGGDILSWLWESDTLEQRDFQVA